MPQLVQSCKPDIDLLIDMPKVVLSGNGCFDPVKHLVFEPPNKIHKMEDLKLPKDTGVSPIAVSEPFRLFSMEAIHRMRSEVLSNAVMENCKYSSDLAQCQLRGFAAKYAPFVYDTWKNPKTLAAISKVAGIDLVPVMEFEIGHVNISVKSEQKKREELAALAEKSSHDHDEGIAGCPWEDEHPVVGWHYDSYPFVCVTMLSDCTNMVGGETALKTGTGEIMKVRGPQMGCAVVLQGRYIQHQALRALGTAERITMVTSFRPKDPHHRDDTVLNTVRPVSNLQDLYLQFTEYRLEILEERIRTQLKKLRDAKEARRGVPTSAIKTFLEEQVNFLSHMNHEIVPDQEVTMGKLDAQIALGHDRSPKKRRLA